MWPKYIVLKVDFRYFKRFGTIFSVSCFEKVKNWHLADEIYSMYLFQVMFKLSIYQAIARFAHSVDNYLSCSSMVIQELLVMGMDRQDIMHGIEKSLTCL